MSFHPACTFTYRCLRVQDKNGTKQHLKWGHVCSSGLFTWVLFKVNSSGRRPDVALSPLCLVVTGGPQLCALGAGPARPSPGKQAQRPGPLRAHAAARPADPATCHSWGCCLLAPPPAVGWLDVARERIQPGKTLWHPEGFGISPGSYISFVSFCTPEYFLFVSHFQLTIHAVIWCILLILL